MLATLQMGAFRWRGSVFGSATELTLVKSTTCCSYCRLNCSSDLHRAWRNLPSLPFFISEHLTLGTYETGGKEERDTVPTHPHHPRSALMRHKVGKNPVLLEASKRWWNQRLKFEEMPWGKKILETIYLGVAPFNKSRAAFAEQTLKAMGLSHP